MTYTAGFLAYLASKPSPILFHLSSISANFELHVFKSRRCRQKELRQVIFCISFSQSVVIEIPLERNYAKQFFGILSREHAVI